VIAALRDDGGTSSGREAISLNIGNELLRPAPTNARIVGKPHHGSESFFQVWLAGLVDAGSWRFERDGFQ
jgi:hypothetical protein